MANQISQRGLRKNSVAKAASTAAAGTVLTYTPPANKTATVTCYFNDSLAGAVACSIEHVVGANTFRPESTAGASVKLSRFNVGIQLQAGETIRWVVTTAFAATTADFAIHYEEEA